jgi:thioredoxin-like negative regulator of GroEL
VTRLTALVVLHVALAVPVNAAAPVDANYATAYKETTSSGKPLVVLVGADWCPGCRTMHNSTMPQAAQRGLLKDVSFAHVNTDHEGALARQLMTGGSIPQLVMFYETPQGWQKKHLIGAQNMATIEAFLKTGVEGSATVRSSKAAAAKVAQGEKAQSSGGR